MKMLRLKMVKTYVESTGYTAIDITNIVDSLTNEHRFDNGLAYVFTPEKRCSVTMIEYEPELLADLEEFMKRLKCVELGTCNALIGKSAVIPIHNGKCFLGTFKRIVFIDTSNIAGEKSMVIVFEGIFKDN